MHFLLHSVIWPILPVILTLYPSIRRVHGSLADTVTRSYFYPTITWIFPIFWGKHVFFIFVYFNEINLMKLYWNYMEGDMAQWWRFACCVVSSPAWWRFFREIYFSPVNLGTLFRCCVLDWYAGRVAINLVVFPVSDVHIHHTAEQHWPWLHGEVIYKMAVDMCDELTGGSRLAVAAYLYLLAMFSLF